MTLAQVKKLANNRRELRWKKERAADEETAEHTKLVKAIAEWRKSAPDDVIISNVHCGKAPADLGCTYIAGTNPFRNPCLFCGSPQEDVF